MKKTSPENRERKKIAELAREYVARGYHVFADVLNYKSPNLIEGLKPDLVAKKGDEMIIIEVKTSDSMKKSKDTIACLAQYAKKIPGARFDLVVTNPRPQSSVQVKSKILQEELGAMQEGLLIDINDAIKYDRTELVVILAARLLEGLLTRILARNKIYVPPEERTLQMLSDKLAGKKIVSRSVREFASKLQEHRNAVVHKGAIISTKEARDVYQKLIKLLKQW